jgi:hypothetical protein
MATACGGAAVRSMQFRGPDGSTDWWSISCRGDNALCLREARETCPHGYDTADRSDHDDVEVHSRTVVAGGPYVATGITRTRTTTTTNGEMTIKCHGRSLAAPSVEPGCEEGGNRYAHAGACPDLEDTPRRFLANDPPERDGGEEGDTAPSPPSGERDER